MKKPIKLANLCALLAVVLVVTGFFLSSVPLGLIVLGLFCGFIAWILTPDISARKASPSDQSDESDQSDASEPEQPARRYWHDCLHCDADRDTCDMPGTGDDCANCKVWYPVPSKVPRTNGYRADCVAFRAETGDCAASHLPGRCLNCADFDDEPPEAPE